LLKRAKILIVDDQKLFATSLEGILKSIGRDLIGEVSICYNGEEAIQRVCAFRPDVVLLDIFMPGLSGLATLKAIREKSPTTKVLMLSAFSYDTYVKEAVANGASGYILKDTTPAEVLDAIASILEGYTVFSHPALDALVGRARRFNPQKSVTPQWFNILSEKEKRILLLISKGKSNDEIAEAIFLGKHTVRNYISAIYDKMNAKDRFEAMRMAIEAQIHTLVMD
jgi:DNA-binding NarL/FixJ family response regulator